MDELKTLKEVIQDNSLCCPDYPSTLSDQTGLILYYALKQEAIKWIKKAQKLINLEQEIFIKTTTIEDWNSKNPEIKHLAVEKLKTLERLCTVWIGQILFIKHFFNITEEDLK